MTRRGMDRRAFLGSAAATAALGCAASGPRRGAPAPAMVGSAIALPGMRAQNARLAAGGDPLDAVIEAVKLVEADPEDTSVGLGGLPNAEGVVQLDAACMHGPSHAAGAVAALENILHPCAVARAVMEETPHVLLVGPGAYRFARERGHAHVELLTDASRQAWERWKARRGETSAATPLAAERWGTVHCSALSARGEVACTTTTSGLAWKLPGRVGDSPLIGAGLFCDQEGGSAGATGRGESAILVLASATLVELMRRGAPPLEAGLEVLRRVDAATRKQARRLPSLLDADGTPAFHLQLYALALDGACAGVTLRGGGRYALATPDGGPRLEPLVALHPRAS